MTPEQAAALPSGSPETPKWISQASRRDILRYLTLTLHTDKHAERGLAEAALEARIAEDAANQAEKFEQRMQELIGIAEAQKLLAEKLDGQTNTLIALTRKIKNLTVWLVMLTSGLFALTVVLIVLTVTLISKEDRKTQTNWTQALTQTNKTESVIQTNSRPAQ